MVEMWGKTWPDATNTGVVTRNAPTLDIDIRNEEAARAAEGLVRASYEDSGRLSVRFGNAPKRAIPFRTDKPFKKIATVLIAPNAAPGDKPQKIEFLGDGQQVIVDGINPDANRPYQWFGGDLTEIKREELPLIDEDGARVLVESIADLLVADHGYRRKGEQIRNKKKPNGNAGTNGHEDINRIEAARLYPRR
jgi:Bifunctional DNA primase/polymerase, N-terminal